MNIKDPYLERPSLKFQNTEAKEKIVFSKGWECKIRQLIDKTTRIRRTSNFSSATLNARRYGPIFYTIHFVLLSYLTYGITTGGPVFLVFPSINASELSPSPLREKKCLNLTCECGKTNQTCVIQILFSFPFLGNKLLTGNILVLCLCSQ